MYKNGRRLNRTPVVSSTTYQDDSRGTGTYTVRALVDGRERKSGPAALAFTQGYAEVPLADADGYIVQHAWPGDLDGDGRHELVVSRLSGTRDRPDLLEAYTLTGERLWRVDQGPGSYTQVAGNGANDPAPAAISGSTEIGGYRNDDNVTVYDLDGDGRAEVLTHTADGTTFADGATVRADPPADQFVSVIDGRTGTERARQPVPDDFVADGPSGGHFGIAHLDGEHPSPVTKLVTRVGAKRGAFRILFQTWDDYTEPLLTANRPNRVRIVSNGSTVRWWNNGRLVFDHVDPEPYTSGHFAFRTTWSHFAISDFEVRELRKRP